MPSFDGTGNDKTVPTKDGGTANTNAMPENPPSPCDGSRGGQGPTMAGGNRTTPLK